MECIAHDGPVCHQSECLTWHRWIHNDKCACEIRGIWYARIWVKLLEAVKWPSDPMDQLLWVGWLVLAIVAGGMIWARI